ncbi:MAG: diguanylate cyclase [Lachnospiraceae bacterium]
MNLRTEEIYSQLSKEKDQLKQILDYIPIPIFTINENRCLTFINPAALQLFHCDETVIGKSCDVLQICICNTPQCAIEKMEKTGNERTYYEADGRTYMISTVLLEDGIAEGIKYIEMIEDVTEITEAEKTLEAKTIELETMSENLIGGVLITTMEEGFPVIRCNKGYQEMIGRSEEQIVGKCAMQWVIPEDSAKLNEKIQIQLAEKNRVSIEHRLHASNGKEMWVELRGKRTVLRNQQVGVWILTDISKAKKVELDLKVEEERYRIAMQSTEDIIIDYDMKNHSIYHSSKAKEIYGVPEILDHMPQHILNLGVVLQESKNEYLKIFQQLEEGAAKSSGVIQVKTVDSRILWNRLTFTAIFDDEGNTIRAIGILQDITREKNAEIQCRRETRYLELTGKEGTSYYEADLTHHQFISGHEEVVKAYCNKQTDDFDTVVELLIRYKVYEADRERMREYTSRKSLIRNYDAGILQTSMEYRRIKEGEITWAECAIQCFFEPETKSLHCVGYIRNINEMKQRELFLQKKAERDLLTGLYNKVTTEQLIKEKILISKGMTQGAFLLIDLDDFKNINDTLGHAFGDAVLSEVSHGLSSMFDEEDVVGRIGGDEFVAYMDRAGNEQAVVEKAQQIASMFERMYTGMNHNYKITGTIGIALFPQHGNSFEELYKNADYALYSGKREGKHTFTVYAKELADMSYTSIASHKIDANAGKLFSENISEYIVRILYESSDSNHAIGAILELISKHFGFNRGYIFEYVDSGWCTTYQWSDKEKENAIENLLKFPWQVLQNNGNEFDENGIFAISRSNLPDEKAQMFLKNKKVKSLIWFSAMNNGILQAVIGFDHVIDEREIEQKDILILRQVSMLLGIFLMNSRESK